MSSYRLYFSHVKQWWHIYVAGVFAVAVTNATEVAQLKFVQWIVDFFSGRSIPEFFARETKSETFYVLLATLLCVLFIQAISRRLWRLSLGQETHRAAGMMKAGIWNRARFFPKERLDTDLSIGALMNAATSDVGSARLIFGWTLIGATDSIFLTVFSIASMISVNPALTFYLILPFIFLPHFTRVLGKRELEQHAAAQEALGEFNDLAAQAISTIKLQRLTQTGESWTKRLLKIADSYRTKRLKVVFTSLGFVIVSALPLIVAYIILFAVGVGKVVDGSLTPGEFLALQGYLVLLQGPIAELGFVVSEWQRAIASLDRITEIYRVPAAPPFLVASQALPTPSDQGQNISKVENLTFSFADIPVLSDLSFELARGQRLGITGPIGSGKSVLINILAGLNHDFNGKVFFHGQDIRKWSHEEVSRRICVVDQRPFLFADTVRNNIALDRELSDSELWKLLELVSLADEVRAFPNGLDTQLGEWGINLSGGQKQRLTLARAINRNPELLLLDDCLSAVDTVTEEIILANLNKHFVQTTLVWTAHRQSTLRHCHQVIDLSRKELAVNE